VRPLRKALQKDRKDCLQSGRAWNQGKFIIYLSWLRFHVLVLSSCNLITVSNLKF
jgi:hypothetical protein